MASSPPSTAIDGKPSAANLRLIGLAWWANVQVTTTGAFPNLRKTLLVDPVVKAKIDALLMQVCGFRVYTVWQKNDPFVRPDGGRGKSYATLIAAAFAEADDGVAWAAQVIDWMDGKLDFYALPEPMRDLAVITHVAELGRGYGEMSLIALYNFLVDVTNGDRSWRSLKECYKPALTYAEDSEETYV